MIQFLYHYSGGLFMYFDKLIWSSVSPIRKDSTYISLEYVLNDLGVFCKGEQRTKDVGFAMSRIGSPLGMTAVENADYAAKPLGRVVILWSRITDVVEDTDRGIIIVYGNANDKVVIQCEQSMKDELLSRIDSMRQFCSSSPDSDAKAAAWLAWAADRTVLNPYAPLDELIEAERAQIDSREFTDAQLEAAVPLADAEVSNIESAAPLKSVSDETAQTAEPLEESHPAFCPACGANAKPTAKFCNQCGIKL